MRIAVYIDIDHTECKKYNIKGYLINSVKHILTDINAKATFIKHPIVYIDSESKEISIMDNRKKD